MRQLRWVPDVRARLRLRARRGFAEGQYIRQRRLLRQSVQLGLRSDCFAYGPAVELLLGQHGAGRERTGQPGAASARLRRDDYHDEWGLHVARSGRVRCPAPPLPTRLEVPTADGGSPRTTSQGTAHHAKPVCRSTFQCVVSVQRVGRVVTRDAEGRPVGRPRSGRCRRRRPGLCAVRGVNRSGGADHLGRRPPSDRSTVLPPHHHGSGQRAAGSGDGRTLCVAALASQSDHTSTTMGRSE